MGKDRLHLDFESWSELDLTKVGASRYARHHSTEVLMLAYAVNDEPVEQWVPAHGEPMPRILKRELLPDPDILKFCWNASFERQIFTHTLGLEIPFEQWRDPMVLAHSLSLPGSLDKAGQVVGLGDDQKKLARGKALIRLFCQPRKPTKYKPWTRATRETDPEAWEEFLLYNRRDVEAERAIYRRLRKWNLPEHEWDLWHLDQKINDAGIPINMRAVRNAIRISKAAVGSRMEEMREITGLDNPNSTQQLLPWLESRLYPFQDLKKGHVKKALEIAEQEVAGDCEHWSALVGDDGIQEYLTVLGRRLEVSRASVKKYEALERTTDEDGNLRNTLQFAGAGRTWRWSGRTYQPQNLARPTKDLENCLEMAVRHVEHLDPECIEWLYDKPMDLLASCVRPVAQAPEGSLFADADLNAIENRVLGWVARCDKILRVFREGRCPYVDFATAMYHQTYEELWHEYKVLEDKTKRTMAKPAVLGCGYMLSAGFEKENPKTGEMEATGLLGYARDMGIEMTTDQTDHAVKVFRETYEEVVQFWWDIDRAVRRTIKSGRPQRLHMLTFDRSGPFLRIKLPSGRYLHYCRPRVEPKMMPWGKVKDAITYEGLNDKKQWTRIQTHPGKLTENVVQAIARDLLAHGMVLADREGLDIRLHVHDQIVALVPEASAKMDLAVLQECMSVQPAWAEGLPLAADGFLSRVFKKD